MDDESESTAVNNIMGDGWRTSLEMYNFDLSSVHLLVVKGRTLYVSCSTSMCLVETVHFYPTTA